MGSRTKRSERCERCRLHLASCACADLPSLKTKTRLVLCMHSRELARTTATGPLAIAMLEQSELRVNGVKGEPLDLNDLFEVDRRVMLLYPREGAEVLTPELVARDPRPITLVVPDGSWRQAARAARRLPGIDRAEAVVLPQGRETEWGVRHEPKEGGLATLEAIARAFAIVESEEAGLALERAFATVTRETLASRGTPKVVEGEEPLSILYDDPYMVVVNKPHGLLVHRGWGNDARPVLQRLRDQLGIRVHPVHRLDRGTSGVLVFAKSPEDGQRLSSAFESGEAKKRYLALCRGANMELGRIDHPLESEDDSSPKPAITDFRMLSTTGRYSLVEARPLTGRPHQIRKHLKYARHPIIGDVRYGKGEHNRHFRETYGLHRLALHAESLEIPHPRSGEILVLRAPISPDLAAIFRDLGLDSAL